MSNNDGLWSLSKGVFPISIVFCLSTDIVASKTTTAISAVTPNNVNDRSVWSVFDAIVDDSIKPMIAAESLVLSVSLFSSS